MASRGLREIDKELEELATTSSNKAPNLRQYAFKSLEETDAQLADLESTLRSPMAASPSRAQPTRVSRLPEAARPPLVTSDVRRDPSKTANLRQSDQLESSTKRGSTSMRDSTSGPPAEAAEAVSERVRSRRPSHELSPLARPSVAAMQSPSPTNIATESPRDTERPAPVSADSQTRESWEGNGDLESEQNVRFTPSGLFGTADADLSQELDELEVLLNGDDVEDQDVVSPTTEGSFFPKDVWDGPSMPAADRTIVTAHPAFESPGSAVAKAEQQLDDLLESSELMRQELQGEPTASAPVSPFFPLYEEQEKADDGELPPEPTVVSSPDPFDPFAPVQPPPPSGNMHAETGDFDLDMIIDDEGAIVVESVPPAGMPPTGEDNEASESGPKSGLLRKLFGK